MKIYRFPLKITDYQEISLSPSYQIISAAPSRDSYLRPSGYPGGNVRVQGIDLWAKVDNTDVPVETRLGVYLVGTGNPWPTKGKGGAYIPLNFIDTCVMENGLVWHVHVGPLLNPMIEGLGEA
ncbi:hypothetical protein PBI_DAMIEN_85 [Mycobacterium phage Damien]|uniref:hypothetical protein n=1 Tax=Mycobacterium phage Oaker TaxID=1445727 RepID=UPI0003E3107B|nr:hypothetical protein CH12_gp85 [Mycobacterium phage Oaker]YP_009044074.1 hypothetical protein HL12_gp85 [Mycobacterium phage Damien]AHG24476.1 hypothetical protein PBI_OAKER_85 [Mycobacterium phage Oaker]AHZ95446.1 hypothetical protein PBI_DAMIEN_85 [Mycobacterium phage Damien]QLF83968.1 hypothetical protein SEA_BECKERTON_84 [Mycobacterium phage Beckerton]